MKSWRRKRTSSDERFYRDKARYYDLIYSFKDYRAEAARVGELIAARKRSPGNELHDAGCGTGKHLEYFQEDFVCSGVDVAEGMIAIARERLPDVEFHVADMTNMRLGRTFDVITCLFGAIGYVKTGDRLEQTLRTFAGHLKPGGVLVVEPWITPDRWLPGTPHMQTYADDDLKIARLSVSARRDDISILDFHFLVAERGHSVEHFTDRHELGLFTVGETLEHLRAAGLEPELLPEESGGRGMYVAVKPL